MPHDSYPATGALTPPAALADGYRGLLALDVDGPLNPYAAKASRRPEGYVSYRLTPHGQWYGGKDFRRFKGKKVWLNPGHGKLILDLADQTGLRPVWATSWLDLANTHIASAVGLPALPVIQFPDTDLRPDGREHVWLDTGNWKYPTVATAAAGAPLAWLDDDFADRDWAAARTVFERARAGAPTLLCAVDPATGLGTDHCDQIRQWAAAL